MSEQSIAIEYKKLEAVHDHMSKQLHVFGECEVRGGGVTLAIAPPNDPEHGGINPNMLQLALRVTPTAESPSEQSLDYHQAWSDDMPYTQVAFRVEGPIPATEPPTLTITDAH